MSTSPAALQRGQRRDEPPAPRTHSFKGFRALNLTDSRLSIEDDEVAMLENMMYVGRGLQAVPLYNGSAGTALHAGSLVKESFAGQLTFGSNTVPHPVVIVIFEDGSAYQRDLYLDGAVDTLIAASGTFSGSSAGSTAITMWQDGPVLFMDDVAGYSKWDGATYTVIDATKKGHALAVFESHVWLLTAARTITYTAPNSFSDFTGANGAGSFKITDDVFEGSITALHSTVEQLWILGNAAIDALGNVATSGGVTTFSINNAIASLGSSYLDSVTGYFRALTFSTGYSIHSLLGVTPQKLSAKIDRLFGTLTGAITSGPRAGVVQLNGQDVLAFIFQYTDPVTAAVRTELICYQEGKWFLATTPDLAGNRVRDMVSLTVRTAPELYGIDAGGFIYRIFARAADAKQGTWKISTKLADRGEPMTGQVGIRYAIDVSAPSSTVISPITVSLVSEQAVTAVPTTPVKFLPAVDSVLGLRYALVRHDAPIAGERIGLTVTGLCADLLCVEAIHLEVEDGSQWAVVGTVVLQVLFTNVNGVRAHFTNSGGTPVFWLD